MKFTIFFATLTLACGVAVQGVERGDTMRNLARSLIAEYEDFWKSVPKVVWSSSYLERSALSAATTVAQKTKKESVASGGRQTTGATMCATALPKRRYTSTELPSWTLTIPLQSTRLYKRIHSVSCIQAKRSSTASLDRSSTRN
jgi:hypothetical protein